MIIRRPLGAVYQFLMEPANYLLWQSGLVSIKASNGMEVGSVVTFTSAGVDQHMQLEARVTKNDGATHFTARGVRGPIAFNASYILSPKLDGTEVLIQNHIEAHLFFRLAEPVLQSMSDTKYEADLQTLKLVLEADLPDESAC